MAVQSGGVEKLFGTAQVAYEYVATPCFSVACASARFVKSNPLVAIPLYVTLAFIVAVAWLFFGWIFSALWSLVWSLIKLAWYSPLLYVFWRLTSILGRRLLRRMGQDRRVDTLLNTAKGVVSEWASMLGKRVVSRLLGLGSAGNATVGGV